LDRILAPPNAFSLARHDLTFEKLMLSLKRTLEYDVRLPTTFGFVGQHYSGSMKMSV
jgi:hypothetical protein